MEGEPFWYEDCIGINDCSKCPWSPRDVNGLKRCEEKEEIEESEN